jgi:outer membrane protein assembly factor BamB
MYSINMKIVPAVILCLIALLAAPTSAENWVSFQGDNYNRGLTSQPLPTEMPVIAWDNRSSSGSMGGVDACSIVVNDTLYVFANGGNLFAYNKTTGVKKWNNTVGSTMMFQLSTPAYGNGTIFVGTTNGYIAAFDADNGSKIWGDTQLDSTVPFDQVNTPIVYDNGRIYMGTWNSGKYYCYYENGTYAWNYSDGSGGYYWAGAAIVGDYIVFCSEGGNVTSLNKTTGVPAGEIYLYDELNITPPAHNTIRSSINYDAASSRIYSSTEGGYCFYVGLNSNGTFNVSDMESQYINWSTSTPVVYNGRVYVGTGEILGGCGVADVYCLDAETLDVIWNVSLNNGTEGTGFSTSAVQSSPVVSTYYDDGDGEVYIYVTTNELYGKVYCFKDFTGNTNATIEWIWEQPEGKNQYILQGVTPSDGWLYLGNDAGYVFALAGFDGSVDWAYKYQVDSTPGKTDPPTEFSSAEYNEIKVDDNNYAASQTTDADYYAAHRFIFHIDDNEKPWINTLNVTWTGKAYHDSATNGAYLKIWNDTSSAYEALVDGADGHNEFTLTGEVTDIDEYIDSSGNVTVLVMQKGAHETRPIKVSYIETDYVKLVATP